MEQLLAGRTVKYWENLAEGADIRAAVEPGGKVSVRANFAEDSLDLDEVRVFVRNFSTFWKSPHKPRPSFATSALSCPILRQT